MAGDRYTTDLKRVHPEFEQSAEIFDAHLDHLIAVVRDDPTDVETAKRYRDALSNTFRSHLNLLVMAGREIERVRNDRINVPLFIFFFMGTCALVWWIIIQGLIIIFGG